MRLAAEFPLEHNLMRQSGSHGVIVAERAFALRCHRRMQGRGGAGHQRRKASEHKARDNVCAIRVGGQAYLCAVA